jgi:hypothetical protein
MRENDGADGGDRTEDDRLGDDVFHGATSFSIMIYGGTATGVSFVSNPV